MKPKAPNEHEDGMLEYMEDIIGGDEVFLQRILLVYVLYFV